MVPSSRHDVAPVTYLYALLRILFGLIGCAFLFGLRDLGTFWDPTGLIPLADTGWRAWLIDQGWGSAAGRALYFGSLASFILMTLGYRSSITLPLSFVAGSVHAAWNPLPLSAAFEVCQAILFCLIWADCSQVWSIDAWRDRRHLEPQSSEAAPPPSLWPLRLIRFQVALIYLATGLWKLGGEQWRQGSALHYVLSNNGFARFPFPPPASMTSLLTMATYGTLLWELTFPVLVAFRRTRPLALGIGIVVHLGMWVAMELGPFPWVMLASYVSFLDPARVAALANRFRAVSATRPETQTEVARSADISAAHKSEIKEILR